MFNLREVLKEAAEEKQKVQQTDGMVHGGKMDFTVSPELIGSNLSDLFNNSELLAGCVSKTIKEAYNNPANVMLIKLSEDTYGITSEDISRYMKASEKSLKEAVEEVGFENTIELDNTNTSIIFPSLGEFQESGNCLGYHNVGWSSKLFNDCIDVGFDTKTMADEKEFNPGNINGDRGV